jgi:glycosyltransferase involved in cell wall biosynthesis
MKILLAQSLIFIPSHGGANKSNRIMLSALAQHGHSCVAITPATTAQGVQSERQILNELEVRGIKPLSFSTKAVLYHYQGVEVHALFQASRMREYVIGKIREWCPDWVMVASEDPGQQLLEAALMASPRRTIYIARTTMMLPFGPESILPRPDGPNLLGRTTKILCITNYLREYIATWSGLQSVVIPLTYYGNEAFPEFGCFDKGYVTMINPCAIKGISIFLCLAECLPEIPFAAVPGWGTTSIDLRKLNLLPNIHLLPPSDNIDDILQQTRILLVPSLCAEGKGEIIVEAMLRGIPVIASNVGGIPEAMQGIDYLVPVQPITKYYRQFDEKLIPVSDVPEQDLSLWISALEGLLKCPSIYDRISLESRNTARTYAAGSTPLALEKILTSPSITTID